MNIGDIFVYDIFALYWQYNRSREGLQSWCGPGFKQKSNIKINKDKNLKVSCLVADIF